jgi:GNAT superfamily N-acetyltransferase
MTGGEPDPAIIRPARPDELEVLVEMNAHYRAAEHQHRIATDTGEDATGRAADDNNDVGSETVNSEQSESERSDSEQSDSEQSARRRARAGLAPLLEQRAPGGVWMVLDDTGAAIGYAILAWSWSVEIGGPEAVLDEFYVARRGEGFGSRALEAIVRQAWDHGMLRIFMETERANDRARSLYLRHGFEADDSIWLSRLPE